MLKNLLFILIFGYFVSNSQNYHPFVSSNKLWSNLEQSSITPDKETTFIKFSSDTIINSFSYSKVYESIDSFHLNWVLNGFIRETSAKKVLYRELGNNSEKLLYDFGLNIGDTVIAGYYFTPTLVVENIDSVLIFNSYRKQIHLKDYSGFAGEIWIEGIGCNYGTLKSGYTGIVGGIWNLLCYYEDGILKYHNPNFSNCYYHSVNINEVEIKDFKLYPNPNNGIFSIDIKNNNTAKMEVVNSFGQVVYSAIFNNSLTKQFDFSSYNKGIYFIKIKTGNTIKIEKLVIQ